MQGDSIISESQQITPVDSYHLADSNGKTNRAYLFHKQVGALHLIA